MISKDLFEEKFFKMITLCGFTFVKKNADDYFESLKYTDERTLLLAFKEMTEDPPAKLNLKHIKSFISIVKNKGIDGITSAWNGGACSETDCIDGLVITKHRGNSYIWKCQSCRSYNNINYKWFTPENVDDLERKLSKQFDVSKNMRQEDRKDLV